jgi:quercetin dioxygenase-like cupin family protein
MPLIDTRQLPVVERKPGWHGRYFNSGSMTFGHYLFDAGAAIQSHNHPQEEVWNILEGEVEITIGDVTRIAGPGFVGVVPPGISHSVKAITHGRAIVVDHPLREGLVPEQRTEAREPGG